ncbi:MAG: Xaa-Pro peptidase family protein [Candidatus Bathyarchaeia archaeon]
MTEPYRKRITCFQQLMKEAGVEASVIRTLSSFRYFAGVKWLRPSLLVPAEGEATAFVQEFEAEEFASRSWVERVESWRRPEELMGRVTTAIKRGGYRVVGFDYSVERDSYVLLFELFKRLNPQVEVRDVHSLIMKLRMIKDTGEVELIKRACQVSDAGMKAAVESVDEGISELEIGAEAFYRMMRMGSENPHVYVNVGPRPRKHAEPRADIRVGDGQTVSIVTAGDHEGYYGNVSRTVFFPQASEAQRKALDAVHEACRVAAEALLPGASLADIEAKVRDVYKAHGYLEYFSAGFTHGVGLLVEEDPITTIVVPQRRTVVAEGMVLAAVHVPLTIPGLGSVKREDTFLINSNRAEPLTSYGGPLH